MRLLALLVVTLALSSCADVRRRACEQAGGAMHSPDVCRLPSNALSCPTGFATRDEHGFYVDCQHTGWP